MSSVNNQIGVVPIIVQLGNLVYTSNSILDFNYVNEINRAPSGVFTLTDLNSDFLAIKSGDDGVIFFIGSSDDKNQKQSSISFIIDEIQELLNSGANTAYIIKWSAGIKSLLKKETRAFKGNSIDSIVDTCNSYQYNVNNYFELYGYESPSDTMTWRFIQNNFWESMDTVISKSYLKNDYMFWAVDDVNDVIKISSLNLENSFDIENIFIYSIDANTSDMESKAQLLTRDVTIWSYAEDIRTNELGKNRDKLFPNVSFSGVTNGEFNQAKFNQKCFLSVLQSMGDNKISELQDVTGFNAMNDVFGDLQIRRHWPNNTHKMYSLSDIYRDYKISTYGKVIYVKIYNNIGPELGSKCAVMTYSRNMSVVGESYDNIYTDTYILHSKVIKFKTVEATTTGRIKGTGNAVMITILKLVSEHYNSSGFENTMTFFNSIGLLKNE